MIIRSFINHINLMNKSCGTFEYPCLLFCKDAILFSFLNIFRCREYCQIQEDEEKTKAKARKTSAKFVRVQLQFFKGKWHEEGKWLPSYFESWVDYVTFMKMIYHFWYLYSLVNLYCLLSHTFRLKIIYHLIALWSKRILYVCFPMPMLKT